MGIPEVRFDFEIHVRNTRFVNIFYMPAAYGAMFPFNELANVPKVLEGSSRVNRSKVVFLGFINKANEESAARK